MKFPKIEGGNGSGVGKDDFVKLKDGDSVKGVFVGDPVHWYQIFNPGGRPTVVPQFTKGGSFRFRINLVVVENGTYVAKVFEQGKTVWDALNSLEEDYKFENFVMKISRKGSTKDDTVYSVIPAPGGELTPEQKAKIAAVKLHPLKAPSIQEAPEPKAYSETPGFDDSEDPGY